MTRVPAAAGALLRRFRAQVAARASDDDENESDGGDVDSAFSGVTGVTAFTGFKEGGGGPRSSGWRNIIVDTDWHGSHRLRTECSRVLCG